MDALSSAAGPSQFRGSAALIEASQVEIAASKQEMKQDNTSLHRFRKEPMTMSKRGFNLILGCRDVSELLVMQTHCKPLFDITAPP